VHFSRGNQHSADEPIDQHVALRKLQDEWIRTKIMRSFVTGHSLYFTAEGGAMILQPA
jgi:hypothetical protein